MTVSIRSACPGEAGLVFAFVRELAAYERLADAVDASEAMLDAALFGRDPRVFCDIAEWDGAPAGFALWFPNFSTFRGRHGIYLEDIFVRPPYRRRGIGRALFHHLARHCVERGWTRFEWAVLDWNAPSIAFYRSLGAQLLDEWTVCRISGDALTRLAAAGAR
ncbi:MAG TPA: GNAT family N-acetyltransferase [Xanthobacteraceae bacterium]|jgi:diamine N-acetyltransferase